MEGAKGGEKRREGMEEKGGDRRGGKEGKGGNSYRAAVMLKHSLMNN